MTVTMLLVNTIRAAEGALARQRADGALAS
jgi:hypothetical protein